MKFIPSLFALFLLAFAYPALADPQSEADIIKQNITAMWAAVEAGDVEAYLDYVHENYTVFGEGDIYLQSGKDKELASYSDYLKRVTNVRTFMHQPEVTVRGDTAWITYYWTDSGYSVTTLPSGKKTRGERFTSKGKSTRIFVREAGQWLCIHGHFTAVE